MFIKLVHFHPSHKTMSNSKSPPLNVSCPMPCYYVPNMSVLQNNEWIPAHILGVNDKRSIYTPQFSPQSSCRSIIISIIQPACSIFLFHFSINNYSQSDYSVVADRSKPACDIGTISPFPDMDIVDKLNKEFLHSSFCKDEQLPEELKEYKQIVYNYARIENASC